MDRESNCDITRSSLSNLRTKCLRRGLWFRRLQRIERGIINLTIRYVEAVKSSMLTMTIARIMIKMKVTLNQRMLSILKLGRGLAETNSRAAVSLGNAEALKWKHDLFYIRYLGVNALSSRFSNQQVDTLKTYLD